MSKSKKAVYASDLSDEQWRVVAPVLYQACGRSGRLSRRDIFYARMVWPQIHYYDNVWRDTGFLYPRFKRGMLALAKAQPDSISVPNVLMHAATLEDDNAAVKQFFASPKGNIIVGTWWTAEQQVTLPSLRMGYLAK